MPFFSIIMPIYNSEKYLKGAIESVLAQTFPDFELILVDDGSTDASATMCDEYEKKDSRIKVIHQKNAGICGARNAGMKASEGEYIGFIDNDDKIDGKTLEVCHEYIIGNQLDWIKFGKKEVLENEAGEIIKTTEDCISKKIYINRDILDALLKMRADGRMTYVWDGFFKSDIIKEHNLEFDTAFVSGNEDIDLCEQYAEFAKRLLVIEKNFYEHYTRIGVSASSKYSEKKIESYLYLLGKSNERYKRYGIDYEKNVDYQYMVSKQILLNVCQKLNDAGKILTQKQKEKKLSEIRKRFEMQPYNNMDPRRLKNRSYKLYLYNFLYQKDEMWLLLKMDKYSRKIVYGLRRQMERK